MNSLGIKNTLDGLASASGVRWYRHVLRRDNGVVLRRALDFEVAAEYDMEEMWKSIPIRLDRKGRMPLTE